MTTRAIDPAAIAPQNYLGDPPDPTDAFAPAGAAVPSRQSSPRQRATPRRARPIQSGPVPPGCLRISLDFPTEVDDVRYDAVVLRRARAKDMRVLIAHMGAFQRLSKVIQVAGQEAVATAAAQGVTNQAEIAKMVKAAADAAATSALTPEFVDGLIEISAALADLTPEIVGEFDFIDLSRIAAELPRFFPQTSS